MPSVGQTWVLASIGAVVEIGDLIRTLKSLWSLPLGMRVILEE
jgi:hypothetical protein